MSTHHPLYLRAREENRYAGKLPELITRLRREAFNIRGSGPKSIRDEGRPWNEAEERACRERDLDFAWVVLPRGAIVGLRIRNDMDMRKELRIARQERPKDERATQAWQLEVETFLKHFGVEPLDGKTPAPEKNGFLALPPHPNDEAKGVAAVRFLELRHGEIEAGRSICARCVKHGIVYVTEWWPAGGIDGQRCQAHAVTGEDAAVRTTASGTQLSLVP